MGACFSSSRHKTASESLKSTYPVKAISKAFSNSDFKKPTVPNSILEQPFKFVEEDYEIGKELGRGLYGITRQAKHRKTGDVYACKSINKESIDASTSVMKAGFASVEERRLTVSNFKNVKKECDILRHISGHPNVASLVEAYEDESHVHFILELCSGGMLYDSITAKGHYSEQQAASILRTMVKVVAHFHEQGVIHRDLKLENFMLKSKGEDAPLMAIDFGLSTFFEPGQRFQEIVGSAYYVAPEVLRKNYGKECDIWSVGVILYMLLCGVPPFWDVSEVGICAAVLTGEYDLTSEPWPSISESAKDLVRRMLEMDISKRITAQEILEHEWAREGGCASHKPMQTAIHKRVHQFCLMNKMKRHALHVIADCCLDARELEIIRTRFDRLDADKDGFLTYEELLGSLKRLKVPITEDEVKAMFDAADMDGSGALDFAEYASAIMVKRMDPARIRRAFEFFDREGQGFITVEDLRSALSEETKPEVIDRIMQEVNTKKDGKIDFPEFERMMKEGMETESTLMKGGGRLSEMTMSRLDELYACYPATGQRSRGA